jgi:hypothetical protein
MLRAHDGKQRIRVNPCPRDLLIDGLEKFVVSLCDWHDVSPRDDNREVIVERFRLKMPPARKSLKEKPFSFENFCFVGTRGDASEVFEKGPLTNPTEANLSA